MFTGIISDLGRVRAVVKTGDTRFEFATRYDTAAIDIGASICCSGACMTVIDKGDGWFAISASDESLSCTTMGDWREGTPVNFERSLRMGDEMGGHIVSGHVDGVGEVVAVTPENESVRLRFRVPDKLAHFIAPKGSVAIDGVSMTVNEVEGGVFGVNVIPHTQEVTTLGRLKVGSRVNLEIDMLARYVARLLERE
ncbi:riboflavin synthase [Shumkonia mesophila]|uniref:riboflavin synthase n=1 Tax=Shumkonia mesophila TaxID=2838854 RepID=UPI00293450AB|nr:riboflavin synthase [Shumkonia mesophila]